MDLKQMFDDLVQAHLPLVQAHLPFLAPAVEEEPEDPVLIAKRNEVIQRRLVQLHKARLAYATAAGPAQEDTLPAAVTEAQQVLASLIPAVSAIKAESAPKTAAKRTATPKKVPQSKSGKAKKAASKPN